MSRAQPTSVRPTAAKRTSVVLASAKTDAIIEEMKTLTVSAARAIARGRGAGGAMMMTRLRTTLRDKGLGKP